MIYRSNLRVHLNNAIIQLYVVFLLVSRRLAIGITNKNIDESYEMFIDRPISSATMYPFFFFLIAYVKIVRSANQKCIYVSRFSGSSYEDRIKSGFSRFTEKRFENSTCCQEIWHHRFLSFYLIFVLRIYTRTHTIVSLACYRIS